MIPWETLFSTNDARKIYHAHAKKGKLDLTPYAVIKMNNRLKYNF